MSRSRLSQPDHARRRFVIAQTLILLAFALVIAATRFAMHGRMDTPHCWLLAAGPLALLALWAWQFFKIIRDEDEMMHLLHLRAIAIGGVLVLLLATMWGILEQLLEVPSFPLFLLLPAFAMTYGFAYTALKARG